jgi:hypothetical protein
MRKIKSRCVESDVTYDVEVALLTGGPSNSRPGIGAMRWGTSLMLVRVFEDHVEKLVYIDALVGQFVRLSIYLANGEQSLSSETEKAL